MACSNSIQAMCRTISNKTTSVIHNCARHVHYMHYTECTTLNAALILAIRYLGLNLEHAECCQRVIGVTAVA